MLFQTSLGVDIQDSSVSIAYLKASIKGPQLAAHAIYPQEKEQSIGERVDQIGALIQEFLKKKRISPAGIFLGIPRDLTFLRYVELPLSVKENLLESLGYEIDKYIPLSADEVCFDYQIIAEDKEAGKIRLLLVVVKKAFINPYLGIGKQVGAGISGIEISSTAMANYFSFQSDTNGRDACAVVFLRNDTLEVNLFRNGFLEYSRAISRPEGNDNLPDIISQELEKLKQGSGQNQARLETIFCGPEGNEEVLEQFSKGKDVEIRLVDLSRTGIPSFAMIPAYGLALKGIQKVPTDINFLPEELRRRPSKIAYYVMFVLTGVLILSALAWGGGNILSQHLYLSKLGSEIDRLGAEITNIDSIKEKCREVEDRADYLATLRTGRLTVLNVIKELTQRIPKSAWVSKFSFSDKGVEVEGWARSASELIPVLEASPLFKDVTFLSSITRNRAGNERFRIGLKFNNLPPEKV